MKEKELENFHYIPLISNYETSVKHIYLVIVNNPLFVIIHTRAIVVTLLRTYKNSEYKYIIIK